MKAFSILLISTILLFSCKKEDDDAIPATSNKLEYKDQDLQGLIGGEVWVYAQGGANTSKGGFESDYTHNFNIVDTAQIDSCFADNNERPLVLFAIFDDQKSISVGKHTLLLDFTSESRTVTLVNYESDVVNNIVCQEGKYEILSVDTINKIVTGRMIAMYDSKNFINGNFELKYCFWAN